MSKTVNCYIYSRDNYKHTVNIAHAYSWMSRGVNTLPTTLLFVGEKNFEALWCGVILRPGGRPTLKASLINCVLAEQSEQTVRHEVRDRRGTV